MCLEVGKFSVLKFTMLALTTILGFNHHRTAKKILKCLRFVDVQRFLWERFLGLRARMHIICTNLVIEKLYGLT